MLDKQGWKFLIEPDSLVSCIYKARYFPTRGFFPASLGHNPSYVWRSILNARFIVRGGARWCIGLGVSILVLNEPCLPNGERIDPNIPGLQFLENFSVGSLFHPMSKEWNQDVNQHIFLIGVVDSIMRKDFVLHYVKSTYKLCVDNLIDTSHLCKQGNSDGIWRLRVPPKVKNLIWRMCRGCLPTCVTL